MDNLTAFSKEFELDLAVVNLLDDDLGPVQPLVKFGQPSNTFAVPLADLAGHWVKVVADLYVGTNHNWSHGAPTGWDDGVCIFSVYRDDVFLTGQCLGSCNLAPASAWWMTEGGGIKGGPGGAKLIVWT